MTAAIRSYIQSGSGSAITNHVENYPPAIMAGDLLICDFNYGASSALTWPAGWQFFPGLPRDTTNGQGSREIRYKIADGTETGTFLVTSAAAARESSVTMAIQDWSGDLPFIANVSTSGANANPPNLDTGAVNDYLFVIFTVWNGTISVTGTPANYTNLFVNQSLGGVQQITNSADWRQLTGQSDDPSPFTSASAVYTSTVMAFAPIPAPLPASTATQLAGNHPSIEQVLAYWDRIEQLDRERAELAEKQRIAAEKLEQSRALMAAKAKLAADNRRTEANKARTRAEILKIEQNIELEQSIISVISSKISTIIEQIEKYRREYNEALILLLLAC